MVSISSSRTRIIQETNAFLDEVIALVDVNSAFLHEMTATVEKYLNRCGRRWVELEALFSFMKVR